MFNAYEISEKELLSISWKIHDKFIVAIIGPQKLSAPSKHLSICNFKRRVHEIQEVLSQLHAVSPEESIQTVLINNAMEYCNQINKIFYQFYERIQGVETNGKDHL